MCAEQPGWGNPLAQWWGNPLVRIKDSTASCAWELRTHGPKVATENPDPQEPGSATLPPQQEQLAPPTRKEHSRSVAT
eukprot:2487971-Alexandrium_andersonii.AAC.1